MAESTETEFTARSSGPPSRRGRTAPRRSPTFRNDTLWRIEGHSLASKEYRTRREFIGEVLAPFDAPRSTPWATADPTRTVAPGSWVRRRKVADGTAFYDSISFNELWIRLEP